MHYGILGTTTAHHDDGTPVPLGGARLRALLAALVLRQGRPVSAELLVGEVWDGELPQDAAAALQTLVGRLRRTVGREEVGSGPGGYWLTGSDTDLGRFQQLAERGRTALEAGESEQAARQLREALALWRGPALADLPDRAGSAVRLEAQRADVLRQRIAADLALGRAAEVSAELAGLCADRPLDEPLHVLWLRALHRSGRTAEALSRYETVRRSLADRLGVDPGSQLAELHRELLSSDAAPKAPAPARQALKLTPVRPAPAGNLRARLTSFVGREQDLDTLAALLTSARLVTLTGPGGSGKTRLSVEAGHRAQLDGAQLDGAWPDGSWPDGTWLAELAPLQSPSAVPGAVLSALGLRGTLLHHGLVTEAAEGREDPLRRIIEHCGRGRMLLILDNCEHLIQAAAELADQLLTECPGLTILATSREPLGVPGEAVLPVEPLPDPVALRLLAERGAAARAGFDPADDPAACAEICRRLDGLPLAIELAAARLRSMTAAQLAARLDGRFALLTGGSRTVLPRQQTLRAVVDWSWELLDKRERAVLRRLSVFSGGWTLEDAAEVCSDVAELPAEDVAELIFSLVDKSLLVAGLDPQGPPRYRMLETIHEYAAERLAQAAEPEVALRHLACFRELVRTAELSLHGPRQAHWLEVLEREKDNIRAAMRRAVDGNREPDALVLVLGMSWFWGMRNYREESQRWFAAVAALGPDPYAADAPAPQPLDRLPLEYPMPLAEPVLDEMRRQLRLQLLVSKFDAGMEVMGNLGNVELAERILAVYGPDLPQSYTVTPLLRVFAGFLSGWMHRMHELLDDAVAGCRRYGHDSALAFALQLRAKMSNDLSSELSQAAEDGVEALEIYTRLGDGWGMAEAFTARAETAANLGDSATAVHYYERSIELAEELGARQDIPTLRIRLGEALMASDPSAGELLVRRTVAELRPGDDPGGRVRLFGHLLLCGLQTDRGEYEDAERELDTLSALDTQLGATVPEVFEGMFSCTRALVTALRGEIPTAVEQLRQGRRLLRAVPGSASVFAQHVTMMVLPVAVAVLALAARSEGDLQSARGLTVLFGAHSELTVQGTYLLRRQSARSRELLLGVLGEAEYERAYAEGAGLPWEEAVALFDELIG
ncbi:putative ATPase/DNA-binding SARP family transcriptional activator [Kitasatospora sp. MAP12-15]|uniref:ATP-binding protein n=1 Tax=unclassified Kitasatospora TaxID=2633591 RepID=UPI002474CEAF|nr:BTAD domain-containing putative transcriptional regulator [Kitasatospora sp. MAP12-44]MDH6110158.1 putative ATPase/DNA-binding SARP family transcriptional activator [Kitasatospora sp. MAP12-44]